MRRQKDERGCEWCSDMNLSLQWTYQEYGGSERGFWSVASGFLWQVKPQQLMASITVHNREYILHALIKEGLSDVVRREVEKHLKELSLVKANYGWFQN